MPLFIYGTLRQPELLRLIAGQGASQSQPAKLHGYRVERAADSSLPVIVPKDGDAADGVLLSDLSVDQDGRLDAYETPFGYARAAVKASLSDGRVADADVYLPPEGKPTDGTRWKLDEWEASDGAVTLHAARELDRHDPPLTAAELTRQWPMIRARACAKQRASESNAPSTVRYAPVSSDTPDRASHGLWGGFFKMEQATLTHRRFDGIMSEPLQREVFHGVDAALVLPYDPVLDQVLLVEQFRVGPYMREDANPWILEPVAGIVDAGESPEAAAARETVEEAGLADVGLRKMFSFYPSPGNITDHFYCYLGLADLSQVTILRGGLESEAEDLRLHILDREAALELIETGEINAGPLITMLYWLDRNRQSLDAAS